jgi:hypothetical protein
VRSRPFAMPRPAARHDAVRRSAPPRCGTRSSRRAAAPEPEERKEMSLPQLQRRGRRQGRTPPVAAKVLRVLTGCPDVQLTAGTVAATCGRSRGNPPIDAATRHARTSDAERSASARRQKNGAVCGAGVPDLGEPRRCRAARASAAVRAPVRVGR